MISSAIWVLEQEHKWAKRNFSWGDRRIGPGDSAWLLAGIGFGIVQTAAISIMPYYSIIQAAGHADDYVWLRTQPKGFSMSSKGVRAVGWSTSRRAMLKYGAAKVGSRFIPYAGWALLAYDLWNVGKWIGEKTS